MHKNLSQPLALTALLLAAALSAPAHAGKPEWAGGGAHGKHGHGQSEQSTQPSEERHGGRKSSAVAQPVTIGGYFREPQREAVQTYYQGQHRRGKGCPPGLAKKNNGCMPPGQARKWAVGQPLPSDVVYYPVPQSVVVTLGVPPAGYRYVRVAADILLITAGSRMVVDGIQDLVR